MNHLSNTVNMTIRIDKDLKKDVDILFKDLGTNTSSAIMMFLKQCSRDKKLPFIPSMISYKPTKELLDALNEAEQIKKDINRRGYNSIDELLKDLDN